MADVVPLHTVHPDQPTLRGRCFSDMAKAGDFAGVLAERGLMFLTEFDNADHVYAGSIVARDWAQAEAIAAARGLGEVVIGQIAETIQA